MTSLQVPANEPVSRDAGGSNRTVLIALAINALIAAAKAAAGVLSGSGALMSEAAHSVADILNETFFSLHCGAATAWPMNSIHSVTGRNASYGRCWPQ